LKKLVFVALCVLIGNSAVAADFRIGFVNTERVFRDAAPAVRAQKKIEQEFAKRDQEMQKMAEQIRKLQESLEKNLVTMTETERRNKQRDFGELNKDFQRKQREFREDLNQRRNEELAAVLDRANRTIKAIAESEKYDIIFQEAVLSAEDARQLGHTLNAHYSRSAREEVAAIARGHDEYRQWLAKGLDYPRFSARAAALKATWDAVAGALTEEKPDARRLASLLAECRGVKLLEESERLRDLLLLESLFE